MRHKVIFKRNCQQKSNECKKLAVWVLAILQCMTEIEVELKQGMAEQRSSLKVIDHKTYLVKEKFLSKKSGIEDS